MSDQPHPRMVPLLNFQSIMMSGSGYTVEGDLRGQLFDERLKQKTFSETGLQTVAESLMENIRRLLAHATLPGAIFNYGRRYQEVYTLGANLPVEHRVDGIEEAEHRDMQGQQHAWRWIVGGIPHSSEIGFATNFNQVAGFGTNPEPIPHVAERKQFQIQSLADSLLIESWTLFESLSEDLWEAALNFHPTVLAELNGKFKLSFNDLQMNDFNVRSKLGTILRRKEGVGFRSLKEIRSSYKLAFAEQSQGIEDILNNKNLQYAAAVRNLLIHKRGIVDKEFVEQTAGIPGVPVFDLNSGPIQFSINGELCGKLTDTCRVCACWLVSAVHDWIQGHPER